MRTPIYTAHQEATVADVLGDLATHSISCAVIVENRMPVGIITERDIVELVVEKREIQQLPVQEVMSSPLHTVTASTTIYEAARLMQQ